MGDNLYTSYWQSVLPNVLSQFKEGKEIIQLPVKELSQYGDRKSYHTNFRIVNGKLENSNNAYAQGRDLHAVLSQDEYFKDNLSNVTMQVTVSKDQQLKIEILAANAPDFFTEEDFAELSRFEKQTMDNANDEHKKTYELLKVTYNKMEYWAKQVQQKMFPGGSINIRKRPTNQANKFEEYQWAKIYPDKEAAEFKILAFTVGIVTEDQFQIKVDTVGLSEDDEKRQKYYQLRGDYRNSKIVKLLPHTQVLDKGWQYLIDLTANLILELKPAFDSLLNSFRGVAETIQKIIQPNAMSLNTILYGPPGTGKTYNTIDKALEIVDNRFYKEHKSDRKVLTSRFNELLIDDFNDSTGQIAFCTFHQSMSYEDFVEGIKPLKPIAGESLKYDIEDGIFTSLCKLANSNFENSKIENSGKLAFEEAFQMLQDEWDNDRYLKFPLKTQGFEFTILGFTNTSIRFEKASGGTGHTLSINTLRELYYGKEYNFKQGVGIYYPGVLQKLNSYRGKENKRADLKSYVLIIDEINRGNVSQIFGELITLIEEDKRAGKEEALSVTLPYSKTNFSVPPNLYIIGTMNTADRSVEALDTALRRRFVFEEKLADLSAITESPEGVDLVEMLFAINRRLSTLLSKDHTIGHAWLMKIDTLEKLQAAFKNKILPLLQEFFYHDYGKIGLVLGDAFVAQTKANKGLFAKFKDASELAEDYDGKAMFTLKDPFSLTIADFQSIYQ